MAQWVAIGVTVGFGVIAFAVLWGIMQEHNRGQDSRLDRLEQSSQTSEERKAVALLAQQALDAHVAEDELKFGTLEKTMERVDKNINAKLDTILGILTRSF